MDVARAPMGYRDVPSGRASVAGEFVRVARLHRARMSGQAFLVPFCGGGLPPFDKRDSPEGAKQDGRADSERRRNTQAKATGLFPFGPAQALFVMEPRPAFAGMTGVGMEVRAKVREQARSYRHERARTAQLFHAHKKNPGSGG